MVFVRHSSALLPGLTSPLEPDLLGRQLSPQAIYLKAGLKISREERTPLTYEQDRPQERGDRSLPLEVSPFGQDFSLFSRQGNLVSLDGQQ